MLTPGQILQKRRMELRKSVTQVSQETKIQEKYIKLLESEEYEAFDSNVFISGFIKIYSEYLGLDVDKMLALYRRSAKETPDNKPQVKLRNGVAKKALIDWKKVVTPLNLIIIVAVIAIGATVFSSIKRYNELQTKPKLEITTPENNTTTESDKIEIMGATDNLAEVKINEQKVETNNKGNFTYTLALNEGENIITVEALNKETELKNVKTIRIERVKASQEPTKEPVVEAPKSFKAYIEVVGEAAWIQFSIDEQQKLAQVVAPGKSEIYDIKKSLTLLTGKPTTTKLFINDKEVKLSINTTTGTASITCTIENNQLNCPQ